VINRAKLAIGLLASIVALSCLPLSATAALPRATILYSANWRHGTEGWSASGGAWTAHNGVLTFRGTGRSRFVAPYAVHVSSYAIVARIRLVRYRGTGVFTANTFGILFRANSRAAGSRSVSGLGGGVVEIKSLSGQVFTAAIITNPADPSIDDSIGNYADFNPAGTWHTYRVEVRGNHLTLRVDGQQTVDITRRDLSSGPTVGLFSTASQIEASTFAVITL